MAELIKIENGVIDKIKPMHCCGGGPRTGGAYLSGDATEIFKEIGIPSCRLHDIEGAYSMNQFVDVHCVFPEFNADENDDRNYNFSATDKYLLGIQNVGAQVFYRLGESIDHFDKKLYVVPPKDYEKWARICEHIIRHYNEGWAFGYYMNIQHWEIWNEPESRCMWRGTYQEFYEFYTVVSKHLKSCFPHLKIGGYSAVGFYTKTRDWDRPWFNSLLPFMNGFFEYIKDKDVPLDFFSWHCYALSPEEVAHAARVAREYLDERGYTKTESYLTEFNMFYSLREPGWPNVMLGQHSEHAADVLATMIECQDTPLDKLFYYDLRRGCSYNGAFYLDGLTNKYELLPGFYAMKFFGDLYRLGGKIKVDYEKGKGLYAMGATDGENTVIAVSDRDFDGEIVLEVDAKLVDVIDVSGKLVNRKIKIKKQTITATDGKIKLNVEKEHVYRIELKK